MTEEEAARIDRSWKSDMDLKVDRLLIIAERYSAFVDAYEDYLKLALAREAQRTKWRNAVIEKTLAGFVWAALIFFAVAAWDSVKAHLNIK